MKDEVLPMEDETELKAKKVQLVAGSTPAWSTPGAGTNREMIGTIEDESETGAVKAKKGNLVKRSTPQGKNI